MSRSRIVIIEDEPDIVEVISYNLKREGYQVSSAGRGDDGINLVRNKAPNLVILDLMLPGVDGLSVCQQLKADPLTKDIPIIIVSAKLYSGNFIHSIISCWNRRIYLMGNNKFFQNWNMMFI